MKYLFAQDRVSYEDLASGRVLYGAPGNPAFPVRLASEVFQRCLYLGKSSGLPDPCVLCDPCCGAAYHLCALGHLHPDHIASIIATDVDPAVLDLARRNLSLLSREGLRARVGELERMRQTFGKPSHAEALASAERLSRQLPENGAGSMAAHVAQADATDADSLRAALGDRRADVVFADVPYGWHAQWAAEPGASAEPDRSPLWRVLDALHSLLPRHAIVAIASSKDQRARHQGYRQLQRLRCGRRQITILCPAP